jgi:hypothetical protein
MWGCHLIRIYAEEKDENAHPQCPHIDRGAAVWLLRIDLRSHVLFLSNCRKRFADMRMPRRAARSQVTHSPLPFGGKRASAAAGSSTDRPKSMSLTTPRSGVLLSMAFSSEISLWHQPQLCMYLVPAPQRKSRAPGTPYARRHERVRAARLDSPCNTCQMYSFASASGTRKRCST